LDTLTEDNLIEIWGNCKLSLIGLRIFAVGLIKFQSELRRWHWGRESFLGQRLQRLLTIDAISQNEVKERNERQQNANGQSSDVSSLSGA